MSDLSQGIMTLPVLLAAQKVARVDSLVRKKFLSEEEIQYIADTGYSHCEPKNANFFMLVS